MSQLAPSLEELMQKATPDSGRQLSGGRGLFMEVVNTQTQQVWGTTSAIELADWDRLAPEPPFVKASSGLVSPDATVFRHAPGAPGAPLEERVIAGRPFLQIAIARKPKPPSQPDAATEIMITKAHTVGFQRGRSVTIMMIGDECFVELIGTAKNDHNLILPPGGALSQITLDQPWVIELPSPTRCFIWNWGKTPRSFQGPVELPHT